MTNDIQRARDVLAKWRGHTPGRWQLDGPDYHFWGPDDGDFTNSYIVTVGEDRTAVAAAHTGYVESTESTYASALGRFDADARLIVGTAGNPELLDAIDAMLAMWADWSRHGYVWVPDYVESIAAAIIAAAERMSA